MTSQVWPTQWPAGLSEKYRRELEHGRNRFRWVEYSLSSSLMVVLIAGIVGISDVAALIALVGVNAAMILFGWLMETHNHPGARVDWSPFVFGCIAGVTPWLAIVVYMALSLIAKSALAWQIFANVLI